MSKAKVLLSRRWPQAAEQQARELFDVTLNEDDHQLSAADFKNAMQSYDAVCPTVSDVLIDKTILEVDGRQCRILCNFGVGFNNIDTVAAKAAGVVVTNTPGVLTDCTADITMTLLLMTARRAAEGERLVRDKTWQGWCPTHMLGTKVSGKKLGLVGFGRIAQAVAQRAHFGFGMEISFYDPYLSDTKQAQSLHATQCDSLKDVLAGADFVSLHCPGGGDNTHLIDHQRLAMMKKTALLINTARGDVVDEAALVSALQKGEIAGAGLDVFAKEPTVSEALLGMDNVVLFPHLGSATTETRVAMGLCALSNAQAFFAGNEPPNRVA